MLFLNLAPPTLQIPEFFTIAPVLTSTLTVYRRNRGDRSSLYSLGLRVRYKYYKNIDILVWPGAAHAQIEVQVGPQVYSV